MPHTADGWGEWAAEVIIELKDRKDKHDELRIDFTRLEAEVKTRNKIIWALVGIIIGFIIAALQYFK